MVPQPLTVTGELAADRPGLATRLAEAVPRPAMANAAAKVQAETATPAIVILIFLDCLVLSTAASFGHYVATAVPARRVSGK